MVFDLSGLELQFLNIISNIILTIGLLVIYARLYLEQSDQSEAMRRQTDIMEYNKNVRQQDYEAELDYEVVDREGDEILILLSNDGVGIGYKASLEIKSKGRDPPVELEPIRVPFSRYDSSEIASPATIFPDEKRLVRVKPEFEVADEDGPKGRLSRSEIVDQFDIGPEDLFVIRLVWNDIGGEEVGGKVRGIGFKDEYFQETVEGLISSIGRSSAKRNYSSYSPNIEI